MLTYRVFNVATRAAWAVPLANKLFIGYAKGVRETADRLAETLSAELRPSG
ncbi:hypothetical protein ABT369_32915 [Dactylosporangium sp. NPDC000244]|uniref:hypothetical protein n=1 Tax=Dactylosporangium sp. NPDC000244 TaxID=3154365 RepID=UPI0033168809